MVKVGSTFVHFNDPTDTYDHSSFSLEDALRAMIRKAKKSIHLVSFSLPVYNRNWFLHDVIEGAIKRNVKLTVHGNNHTEVHRLIASHRHRGAEGWAWQQQEEKDIFHIKSVIVDGVNIYLGSANLSENAISSSAEWGIVSNSPELCMELERYLSHLEQSGHFREV